MPPCEFTTQDPLETVLEIAEQTDMNHYRSSLDPGSKANARFFLCKIMYLNSVGAVSNQEYEGFLYIS